jgi:hypothetical protein
MAAINRSPKVRRTIRIITEQFKEQIEFELSDTFKERIKRRPIIEHNKNAEMKRFNGMDTSNTEVSFVCEYRPISPRLL